jgi:origin recognition complex subunit 4
MSKRKVPADALSNDSSAQRRRTRSSGLLLDTQPLFSSSKTRTSRSKRSIAVESSHTVPATDAHDTSSLKENEVEDSGDADELNLSPSRMRHSRARRVVMDSVELPTPSKRYFRNSPQHDAISPAPFLRHHLPNHTPRSFAQQPPSTPSKSHIASRTTLKASALTIEPSSSVTAPSPLRLPRALPPHLRPCLNAQKRAILAALQNPPDLCINKQEQEEDGPLTNTIASQQLSDLLIGTVARGEGNSCLILGPRGSGKTRVKANILSVTLHFLMPNLQFCSW